VPFLFQEAHEQESHHRLVVHHQDTHSIGIFGSGR
jgi:hypothetical protein